jgi:hypothetical protein
MSVSFRGIEQVALTGSRASGQARPESDWDFTISTAAFADVHDAMPQLVAPLRPVVAQWDRLSHSWCYMLILDGPTKAAASAGPSFARRTRAGSEGAPKAARGAGPALPGYLSSPQHGQ